MPVESDLIKVNHMNIQVDAVMYTVIFLSFVPDRHEQTVLIRIRD